MTIYAKKTQNVYTDGNMEELAKDGKLFTEGFAPGQLSGTAYDLRAGNSLTSRQRAESNFDLRSADFAIEPGELVTIQTLEKVDLKDPLSMGLIYTSHTQLSQGIFHPTTSIDPAFAGPLAITLINLGKTGFRIKRGDRIAKMMLFPVSPEPDRLYGTTQKPRALEGSLEHSLTVVRSASPDDLAEAEEFFGGPLKSLAERVASLERDAELYRTKQQNKRLKSFGNFVLILFVGALGSLIANKWDPIVTWIATHIFNKP